MNNSTIIQLVKRVPVLAPEDSVRRAVGLIRASESANMLVANGHTIVGQLNEESIAAFLAASESENEAMNSPVAPLISDGITMIAPSLSLKKAAELFSVGGVDILPVGDSFGSFIGVLFRRDVLGALTNNLRPPSVAGMATPLGVHLTTGSHSGGAGSKGLVLTGVALMLMMTVSSLAVEGAIKLVSLFTGVNVQLYLASAPIISKMNIWDLALYLSIILSVGGLLILLRLSSLSGYHAAEHMTVHAIEAGEELTPERVKHMPRVHPRCGTNLLAAASVFLLITSRLDNGVAMLLAMVVVVIGWRAIGGVMQSLFTTKPPSEKQLASGVAAGNELLKRYMERPSYQAYGMERIWNMGFLQTAAGMFLTYGVLAMLQRFTHVTLLPM